MLVILKVYFVSFFPWTSFGELWERHILFWWEMGGLVCVDLLGSGIINNHLIQLCNSKNFEEENYLVCFFKFFNSLVTYQISREISSHSQTSTTSLYREAESQQNGSGPSKWQAELALATRSDLLLSHVFL